MTTSVIRVQNLEENTTLGELRRTFKDRGARPADIHITPSSGGKPRTGFVVFRDRKEADIGLRADGAECRQCRLIVKPSNPKEFDRMFPGKPMLTSKDDINKPMHHQEKNDRRLSKDGKQMSAPGVVKVDNIDFSASPRDIRKLFKDHGARPADIHLVLQPNGTKHDGSAFLIFAEENETSNALKLNGTTLCDQRLSVKSSSPKEFNRFFPRVAMLSTKPVGGNVRGRGRGRGGGMNVGNVRRASPPTPNMERGRGQGLHSGRGGRGGGFGAGGARGRSSDQFFGGRPDNGSSSRVRSRSPINRGRRESNAGETFDRRRLNANPEPMNAFNERNFLRISGLPYNASQVDIQEFFRPILTRDIFIMRNVGGKYAGKFNGSALIEFFSEGDARQAMKMDGNKFGNHNIQVVRASREEITRTIHENKFSGDSGGASSGPSMPDTSAISAIAQSNPQVQHLLNLLTATVNTIAGAAAAAVAQPKPDTRNTRGGGGDRNRDDPVINRVATSANINVHDIKLGRVVGLRNLPYGVTPEEILDFFRNYKVIPNSVRIHYLDDGRCSGDAIVCFRGNRDARNAVSDLNKGIIGRRKVELFFL